MQRILILFGLVSLACAGMCFAEDAEAGKLIWNTGESLAGSLKGATPKDLIWESQWFSEPLVIDSNVLQDVSYKRPLEESQEAFRVQLADGGCLYGNVVGLDADHLLMKSARHGDLKIRRQQILNIQRLKEGPLLYAGPGGMAGWNVVGGAADLDHWAQGQGAALPMPLWGEMVYLRMPMPDRVEVELQLSSTDRINFEVALGAGKPAPEVPRVEVWDDQLVAVLRDDFVSLTPIASGSRDLALRMLVDKSQNRIVITDLSGKVWADWKPPTPLGKLSGVWLHNRGKDLTLRSLRVMNWDGETPRTIRVDEPRIETLGGAAYYGQLSGTPDGSGLVMQDDSGEPMTLPWNTISRIVFATDPAKSTPVAAAPDAKQAGGKEAKVAAVEPAEAWFTDGGLIRGDIVEVKDGHVSQKTSFSDEPVTSDLGKLLHMQLHSPIHDNLGKVALNTMDWLVLDKMALHGTLSGGEGGAIEWCVYGGRNPVRVNTKGKMSVTRAISTKQNWTAAPALFYLASGDVLPARWRDMDGQTVSFESDLTNVTTLECAQVKAVHFTQSELQTTGFSDPGWRTLKGGEKLVERKADQVKIMPGGSFGHASMLVGDEMNFTLHADQGFATMRVRLYCPADGSDAGQINFVIAHFGSNVYYGLEDDENGMARGRQQLSVQPGSSAKIRFILSDKQIEMRINDVSLHRFPIATSKRLGCGVVFEPSSLWGNQEQPVRLTGFSVHMSPGKSVLPPVRGEAKDQALTVPRFQKDDPPRNVLIASTGDLLRGEIEAATKTHFAFRTGLENIEVPKDRVAAAIWLTRPESLKSKEAKAPAETSGTAGVKPTHWLSLMNGGLIAMKVEKIEGGQMMGKSPLLGDCHVPLAMVYKLSTAAPEREPTAQYFEDWSLRFAPEPVLPTSAGQSSPLLGKTPRNFALPLLKGGNFALSDQAGKVVVLDFWATWCGPCVKSLPSLMKTVGEVQSDKLVFVGINQGESISDVSQFLEVHRWDFKTAMDTDEKVATEFGVEGIPHTVIIGKDGKVAWTRTGYVENGEKEVADVIRRLLQQ